MKVLFFGDVVGKAGRRAVAKVISDYRKKYQPDAVIANGENLAHGAGITMKTVEEILAAGVDLLSGGNHSYQKSGYKEVFTDYNNKVIRPFNYPPGVEGRGYTTLKIGKRRLCLINLNGRVFFDEDFDDPLRAFDAAREDLNIKKGDVLLVDFHAEATSEKSVFGWYVAGRAGAVVGTHTHVPTADAKILPGGTAFITDVGMVGGKDTIIGVEKEGPIRRFVTQQPQEFLRPEDGPVQVNAVYLFFDDKTGRAKAIERADSEVFI